MNAKAGQTAAALVKSAQAEAGHALAEKAADPSNQDKLRLGMPKLNKQLIRPSSAS